ncbi:MAG: hypothetical protein A2Z12_08830 [Actinobacteria bacterium RBG_16_68_21]|nr:MAG: hypothetical protein A2Z12_08830 [Actinobacteria bacterium RBG_16_68_21]
MIDHAAAEDWLERYVAAWVSGDPGDIGTLFSADAAYRYEPADDAVVGRDAIVASWLEDPDAPGTFDAEYHPYAIEGSRVVATGWSRYYTGPDRTEVADVYDNCFIMEFDDDGRCSQFTEWFRRRPRS